MISHPHTSLKMFFCVPFSEAPTLPGLSVAGTMLVPGGRNDGTGSDLAVFRVLDLERICRGVGEPRL